MVPLVAAGRLNSMSLGPGICSAALMCLVLQISETSRRLWFLALIIIQQTSSNSGNPSHLRVSIGWKFNSANG